MPTVSRAAQARCSRGIQATRASMGLRARDERDPAVHWAIRRVLWLRGRAGESQGELERSIDLSPNFALGTTTSPSIWRHTHHRQRCGACLFRTRQLPVYLALLHSSPR